MWFDKNISTARLRINSAVGSQSLYDSLVALPAPPIPRHQPQNRADTRLNSVSIPNARGCQETPAQTAKTCKASVPESALAILRVWLNLAHPFHHQGAIFEKCGITSGSKQASVKQSLLRHGLIREHRLQVRKGFISVWEPLEKAYQLAHAKIPHFKSKGGYLHQFAAHHVGKWASSNGFRTETEFFLPNGKAVDLLLRKDGQQIFVEIGISDPLTKEISNILKDVGGEFQPNAIWVLVRDSKSRSKVSDHCQETFPLKPMPCDIQLRLIGEYVVED